MTFITVYLYDKASDTTCYIESAENGRWRYVIKKGDVTLVRSLAFLSLSMCKLRAASAMLVVTW